MAEMSRNSLNTARARIRQGLKSSGTDVDLNDRDPTGDGDQSPINLGVNGNQFYRNLFATGGDINEVIAVGIVRVLTPFGFDCVCGHPLRVKEALEKVYKDEGKPSEDLIRLLETRETSMRLSPLMLVVAMGKHIKCRGRPILDPDQLEVVKLLLRYGARPDARDVSGKTVFHYGMGNMATKMTMEAVDMCSDAHKSSHLFGKEVELHSLKNKDMNGKQGIAKGFMVDTGRRAVYLYDTKAIVGIKPKNLKLLEEDDEDKDRPNLCDVQDRLGAVCLHDLLMGHRIDVTKHLLSKHHPRADIVDCEDFSLKTMSLNGGSGIISMVSPMVQQYAMQQERSEMKAAQNRCSHCGKMNVDLQLCSRCKKVQYCSRDCQAKDWKKGGHKSVCKPTEGDEGIVIDKPDDNGMFSSTMNFRSRSVQQSGSYRKPSNVAVGEKFYIKVQAGGPTTPLLIYDKTRECEITLPSQQRGFQELYNKVRSETATQGRKTYIKASFDDAGKMTVYPNESTIKSTW